jgi:LacI family repressor for deo operon, udp, cdd, tsx, nupC, and nupG
MSEAAVPMATICVKIAGSGLPHIVVNDRTASTGVVEHLVGLGHRRLGFIAGPAGNINSEDRLQGFREGLAAAGLQARHAICWPGDFGFDSGVRAAEAFLGLVGRRRPTAVFAASDHMAIAFMKSVQRAGLRVPDDVSVVGFDGIEFADFVEPTLTTVRQPRYELGRTGAHVLLEAMRGEPAPPSVIELQAPLVIRESTAAPPGKPSPSGRG